MGETKPTRRTASNSLFKAAIHIISKPLLSRDSVALLALLGKKVFSFFNFFNDYQSQYDVVITDEANDVISLTNQLHALVDKLLRNIEPKYVWLLTGTWCRS